ncbi:1094_t:CDS:2, partial [Racocetra fulgida]
TTCKRCGRECSTSQKLHEHLKQKNPCKALQDQKKIANRVDDSKGISLISTPASFTQDIKRKLSTFENLQQKTRCRPEDFDRKRFYLEMEKEGNKPYTGIIKSKWSMFLNSVFEYLQKDFERKREGFIDKKGIIAEIRKEIFPESEIMLILKLQLLRLMIKKEMKKIDIKLARKKLKIGLIQMRKSLKELDLGDCNRPEDLNQCMLLCHDLEQYDPEAVRSLTKEKLENSPGSRTQAIKKSNKSKREIKKGQEKPEKDLEFREQEIDMAVKRRAIAVHCAKVPKSHPDNGSNIRKILESQRKQFRAILEKEFDKLYNRAEIDDYLSNAFEQILYQVEERGGKPNA